MSNDRASDVASCPICRECAYDDDETSVRGARLAAGTLAQFVSALTWTAIHDLDDFRTDRWWRNAICEAESRGLLEWDRKSHGWILTDAGRVHVRGVS